MRRALVSAAVVPLVLTVLVAPAPALAAPGGDVAAATPMRWGLFATPGLSGDTSQKVYEQIDVVPGGTVFAAGYTRHDLPGESGVRTLVERWDGSSWQTVPTPDVETGPAADHLYGVSGTSAIGVWAVGRSATAPGRAASKPFAIDHDGTSWSKVEVPSPSGGTGADTTAVVAVRPDDVWAVGTSFPLSARGAAYHWDGTAWSSVAVSPQGITIGGEKDTRSGQRRPFAATRLGPQRRQPATIGSPSSVTWTGVVDGSADGPVWAVGQYLDDRARIVGPAARPAGVR